MTGLFAPPAVLPAVLAGLLIAAAALVVRPPGPLSRLIAATTGSGRVRAHRAASSPRTARARRRRPAMPAPIVLDLVASVLAAGAAPAAAVTAVAQCLRAADDPADAGLFELAARLAGGDTGDLSGPAPERGSAPTAAAALVSALELAAVSGLGPVALVHAAADEERRRRGGAQIVAARRLGVMILLPTGLCLLPAFVLLTVVPLVLDLVLG
ncbi:MAG TPA: hypothetical protein VHN80_22630 [Kineosporiaceae bacterium]|nr:hypothetical protein [Kineosporiaceae bacterium]